MPDYLPLCAFRQGLLPPSCRTCAWWQTVSGRPGADEAYEVRQRWLPAVEQRWGAAGLILYGDSSRLRRGERDPVPVRATVHFAPVGSVPRFRSLGFGGVPQEAALLFCLWYEGDQNRLLPKRMVLRALAELQRRGVREVYAVAGVSARASSVVAGTSPEHGDNPPDCRFFSGAFLDACGFEHVASTGSLDLMRADLRGLVHFVGQVQAALKRLFHNEPAPSPATWSRPGVPPPCRPGTPSPCRPGTPSP